MTRPYEGDKVSLSDKMSAADTNDEVPSQHASHHGNEDLQQNV